MGERLRPRQAETAILLGAAAIGAYEYLCDDGQTISEGTDRLRATKLGKYLVPFVVITTALHLLRAIPPEIDWLHRLTRLKHAA